MRQSINISEINRLTGIDRTTLAKHLRQLEPVTANGKKGGKEFYLDEVLSLLVKSFKVKFEDGPKVRKEMADAEKSEIVVAKLRGDLVPIDAVRSSAAALVKSLYQRCVNLAPRLLADKIPADSDRQEVEIKLREHYAAIFEELRSCPSNFINLPIEQQDEEAPAI